MKTDLIFLYGPPGAGKTTAGKALAADLQTPFFDLDGEVVATDGRSIPRIFEEEGEPGFRALEREQLEKLAGCAQKGVVALGGGTLLDPANRKKAENTGTVVLLAPLEKNLLHRAASAKNSRPLIAGDTAGKLKILLDERRGHYESFKTRVETGGRSPAGVARQIQVRLGRFHLPDSAGRSAGCDVKVSAGGLACLGAEINARAAAKQVFLVSDENVAGLYLEPALASLRDAGFKAASLIIPAGEEQKKISRVEQAWEAMLAAGLERGSLVIALGGGVVSDLAGFAAATFLRGLPWVVIPTSLLAMVDAGLGGKTGIDLPQGKNLAGAFHSPILVLADPHLLASLPEREFRGGLAEALKHGLIDDPLLYRLCAEGVDRLREDENLLEEMVRRAVAVKVRVIREDPFENGRRAVLNLGHTVGHAVEMASDYKLSHGEAVAVGLALETRLAEELKIAAPGLAASLAADLARLGLPAAIPGGLDPDVILAALKHDKKRANGTVRFSLAKKVGEALTGIEIDEGRIIHAIHSGFARA